MQQQADDFFAVNVAALALAMWGVTTTFGSDSNGSSAAMGSGSNTSRPAPPIDPSARTR